MRFFRILELWTGHNSLEEEQKRLEFWAAGLISLFVLYATGNLKRTAEVIGIGRRAVVIYFGAAAALAAMPVVYIFGAGVNVCGAFLCFSALCYAAAKRQFDYRFLIAAAVSMLLGTLEFVISNSAALKGTGLMITALLAAAAVMLYREKAALLFTVTALVFNASVFLAALALGLHHNYTLFGNMEMIVLGEVLCILASYAFLRRKGRHAD